MAGSPRRRKKQPHNPAHDRRATELHHTVIVDVIEVDNPLAVEPGDKIAVVRNLRDDPLGRLQSRRQIDDAQFHGGRAFQYDFETAERGPRAIDPSKEAVDGGLMPEAITEGQRKAAIRLAGVYRKLGQDGSSLIHAVLIHGSTIAGVANSRGYDGRRWEEYFGMRFRECLDTLAKFYGFANEDSRRRRVAVEETQYG
jgi:hypothetical protein